MPRGMILLLIVVTISVLISVASGWLRSQQRKLEEQAAERRAKGRTASGGGSAAVKTGASDIDRFLEEINKLRQKPAGGAEPASRPPRKAEPVRKAQPAAPVARRAEPVASPILATSLPRLEDLPVAPVVSRASQLAPAPMGATKPIVMLPGKPAAPPTPMARRFTSLLSDPKSVPLAVMLQEILGPPKCKRT